MKKRKKNKEGDNEPLPGMNDIDTAELKDIQNTIELQTESDILLDEIKPGAQLAAIRKAAGIEQEQMAVSLKMTVRQVRELESDNYESLHGVAITRGFIRAYAKMLQVDPEPLVALVKSDEPVTKQLDQIQKQTAPVKYNQGQSFGKKRSSSGKMIWLLIAVVWLGVAFAAHNFKWFSSSANSHDQKQETVISRDEVTGQTTVSTEIKTPVTAVSDPDRISGQISDELEITAEAEKKNPAKQDTVQTQTTDIADAAMSESDEVVTSFTKPEKNLLMVRFNLPSKIRLLRNDFSVLREVTGKEGEVQQIEINEPVTLLVEIATAVETEFRGQPLVLKSARKSSEAKIDLK